MRCGKDYFEEELIHCGGLVALLFSHAGLDTEREDGMTQFDGGRTYFASRVDRWFDFASQKAESRIYKYEKKDRG